MSLLKGLIVTVIVLIIIGSAFPVIWPMVTGDVTDNITAMSGTDAGTSMFQSFWPIVLMVVGIGIAAGLVFYALRKFGLLGGGIAS